MSQATNKELQPLWTNYLHQPLLRRAHKNEGERRCYLPWFWGRHSQILLTWIGNTMIGCSLGEVISFINYLPYLATLSPFSRFLFLLIFFKITVSEFGAGKVIFLPPQRQKEGLYYSGSLQLDLQGLFYLYLKPTLLRADGKGCCWQSLVILFLIDLLGALHCTVHMALAWVLPATCGFVLWALPAAFSFQACVMPG